jgi:hypothetical protein
MRFLYGSEFVSRGTIVVTYCVIVLAWCEEWKTALECGRQVVLKIVGELPMCLGSYDVVV